MIELAQLLHAYGMLMNFFLVSLFLQHLKSFPNRKHGNAL